MVTAATTIDLSGPFFEADPSKRLFANIRIMLEAIAKEGEADVRAQFPVGGIGDPHPGLGQSGVIGRVVSLSGKPWRVTAVISEQHVYPWANGGQKQYRGGRLEARRHMFRTTKGRISHSRAVNMAELTKGLE